MFKSLLKYVLSLSLLIFSARSLVHAHSVNNDNATFYASTHIPQSIKRPRFVTIQLDSNLAHNNSSSGKRGNSVMEMTIAEDEDDKWLITKKYFARGNQSYVNFYSTDSWFNHDTNKPKTSFSGHLAFNASSRCILFRVFRL